MASKTVLITGSSRGIGRETALAFARAGYNVIVNARRDIQGLDAICNEIRDKGMDCMKVQCDISDPSSVKRMISTINMRFNHIDVLVNNAGVESFGLLSDCSDEEWRRVIGTNLSGTVYCCRAVIPDMVLRRCGSIINISSVWGSVGAACEAAYSASKGGVNALTKALAKELAPSGIAVNAVALGLIDTEMNARLTDEEKSALLQSIPAGRMASAKEAAEFIYSVATSSAYLTGQVISFDGGW
jgi:3-oxoacyl-[acyl-carrier protein] reductase